MIASKEQTESKRGLGDVVGIDLATTGTKVVRLRRIKQSLVIVGLDLLPPVPVGTSEDLAPLSLPKTLKARYGALAATAGSSVVRLLHLPGFNHNAPNAEATVREHAGLEQGFRMSYQITEPATRARPDTGVLTVALPEGMARGIVGVLREGAPAPLSMEVSSLAALSGFAHGPLSRHRREAVGFIEAGAESACLGIFQHEHLVLVRKFDFGSHRLVERISRQMGVDAETAQEIIQGNAIDISQMTREVLTPFLRQLSISKEFVERKGGEPIKHWYLSGGMALTSYWSGQISHTVSGAIRVWNPFEGLEVDPRVPMDLAKGQEVRFAAAIGAALGAMEES